MVKVIDFGVAKALGQQLTDKTLFTGFAQMIGTPLYMRPEQAGLSGLDIDTRSDIYSLGVLLYELLTGTTPFDKERLQAGGLRRDPPHHPRGGAAQAEHAAQHARSRRCRRSSAQPADAIRRKLSQLVRGELDWIVMKALEKDRNRRYETANGFAADVQRYLARRAGAGLSAVGGLSPPEVRPAEQGRAGGGRSGAVLSGARRQRGRLGVARSGGARGGRGSAASRARRGGGPAAGGAAGKGGRAGRAASGRRGPVDEGAEMGRGADGVAAHWGGRRRRRG